MFKPRLLCAQGADNANLIVVLCYGSICPSFKKWACSRHPPDSFARRRYAQPNLPASAWSVPVTWYWAAAGPTDVIALDELSESLSYPSDAG